MIKLPLVMQANMWDKIIGIDNQESYQDELPLLPMFPQSVANNATRNYENITSQVAGTPATSTGKGKKKVIRPATPPLYDNVIDETSLGSFANPIIDRKEDLTTGIFGEVRKVQRADGQWIQLTPREYDVIAKQYTDQNLNAGAVARLPVSYDLFQPKVPVGTIDPNSAAGINAANRKDKEKATTAVDAMTKSPQIQEMIGHANVLKSVTPAYGSFSSQMPNMVEHEEAVKVFEANEAAKQTAYEQVIAQINARNVPAQYHNAEIRGLIPNSPNAKSDEYRAIFGDVVRTKSGNDSMSLPIEGIPAPPLPGTPPVMTYSNMTVANRAAPQPSGSNHQEEHKLYYPTLSDTGSTVDFNTWWNKREASPSSMATNMLKYFHLGAPFIRGAVGQVFTDGEGIANKTLPFNRFNLTTKKVERTESTAADAIDSWLIELGDQLKSGNSLKLQDKFIVNNKINMNYIYEKKPGTLIPNLDPEGKKIIIASRLSQIADIFTQAQNNILGNSKGYTSQLTPQDLQRHVDLQTSDYRNARFGSGDAINAIAGYQMALRMVKLLNTMSNKP